MLRKDPDQKKASPGSDKKVAWPDLSAGGGCLSPNLGLSPLPLALGPATGSSTTASTLPPGRLSGRTRGAETLKSQANQKMKKVRSIKKSQAVPGVWKPTTPTSTRAQPSTATNTANK